MKIKSNKLFDVWFVSCFIKLKDKVLESSLNQKQIFEIRNRVWIYFWGKNINSCEKISHFNISVQVLLCNLALVWKMSETWFIFLAIYKVLMYILYDDHILCTVSSRFIMVLILDGNSEQGENVKSNLSYMICKRHLIDRAQSQIRFLFSNKKQFSFTRAQHVLSYHLV